MPIAGEPQGCFGCKFADPTYRWISNEMIVQCPIFGDVPVKDVCDHATKFTTIAEDTRELLNTIIAIIDNSPAAEHPDNAGLEEMIYENGEYTIKYRGRMFKMQLIVK